MSKKRPDWMFFENKAEKEWEETYRKKELDDAKKLKRYQINAMRNSSMFKDEKAAAAEEDTLIDELDEFTPPSRYLPSKGPPTPAPELDFPLPPKGTPIIQRQSLKQKRTLKQKRSIYPQHSQAIEEKKGEQLDKGQLDAIELYFDEARMIHEVEPEVAFGYLINEVKPTKTIIFAIMSAKNKIRKRRELLAKGTKKRKPRKPKRKPKRTRKRPKTKKNKKNKKNKNRKNKTRYKR